MKPGQRVLDLGCGVGESTLLLARIVGADKSVVGVDRDSASLTRARAAGADAGASNVSFLETTLQDVQLDGPVDVIAGRFVMVYQPDPAQLLRSLEPGGVVTFQEFAISRSRSHPEVPLASQWTAWGCAVYRAMDADPDFGEQLPQVFIAAGLPAPEVVGVSIGGDADHPVVSYLANSLRSIAPRIVEIGAATPEQVDADLRAERMAEEMRARQATLFMQQVVAAWATKPGAR